MFLRTDAAVVLLSRWLLQRGTRSAQAAPNTSVTKRHMSFLVINSLASHITQLETTSVLESRLFRLLLVSSLDSCHF